MAKKSVDRVKASLKLRTESKEGVLTLRIGVKKLILPFETRMLKSDNYVFVHVPPSAEIFKITKDGLQTVTNYDEAKQAQASFRKKRGRTRRSQRQVELPGEVKDALKKLPAGYKLGYDESGKPKLVKKRKRRSN